MSGARNRVRNRSISGLTLFEAVISTALLAAIIAPVAGLISTSLGIHREVS